VIGPAPYAFRLLWRQYRACRRNKRNTRNALAFEADAEANLLTLREELRTHTYRPGRSICFVTAGPKPREVFAADFRDRIVHHLLVGWQEPVFEPRFVHDSYACRRGKGTLAASDRLMTFLRRATANGRRPAWALKLDVASFFPSIDKGILYAIIAARIRDPEVLWLTRAVLFHDPTTDYRFRSLRRGAPGPGSDRYPVPAAKSLFGKGGERGLPIGNLTSQFWGNVYLDELDQWVKRTLRCRHYLRYVDDMVLLSPDPAVLVQWRAAIEAFLRERLGLRLRADSPEPFPVSRGVDFVGWKTWWNRRVPRRRTLESLRRRLEGFQGVAIRPAPGAQRIDLRREDPAGRVERLRAAVASYSGHLRHGAAWREWARVWETYPWLGGIFQRDGWATAERFPVARIARASSFRRQYWALVRRAGERCLVFCPVGRFMEFRGPQRLAAQQVLGLRPANLPRGGFALAAGFPRQLAPCYRQRALQQGWDVVEVRQGDRGAGTCTSRVPSAIWRAEASGRELPFPPGNR
jgi:RNA-directed DNA polymerase